MRRSIIALVVVLSVSSLQGAINVGDKPTLQFTSVQGDKIDLAALKGKIVIVDFWATWSDPCIEEAPHMVQINQKYKDKGLQLIGISLDHSAHDALNGAKEHNLNWPQECDGHALSSPYAANWGVDSIPRAFIIGPEGAVLWTGQPADIDAALEDAFKNHPPQLVDAKPPADASAALDQVALAIKAGSSEKAIKLLAQVKPEAQHDAGVAGRVKDAQAKLQDAGQKMLADAQPTIDRKQYADAVASLQTIASAFVGTPLGDKSQAQLTSLMKIPACKAAVEKARREAAADSALADAQQLQSQKKDIEAYQRFKYVADNFADTIAASAAVVAIKAYDAEPGFVQRARDATVAEKSNVLFGLAKAYHDSGRDDLAKDKLQVIIDVFPGTTYAQEAQKRIDAMGKGN